MGARNRGVAPRLALEGHGSSDPNGWRVDCIPCSRSSIRASQASDGGLGHVRLHLGLSGRSRFLCPPSVRLEMSTPAHGECGGSESRCGATTPLGLTGLALPVAPPCLRPSRAGSFAFRERVSLVRTPPQVRGLPFSGSFRGGLPSWAVWSQFYVLPGTSKPIKRLRAHFLSHWQG